MAVAQGPVTYTTPQYVPIYTQQQPAASLRVAQQADWPPPGMAAPGGPPPAVDYGQQPWQADPLQNDPFGGGPGCASCQQNTLLGALLGTNERVFLPNYYDPFASQQFAYGSLRTTPYRLGWSSYRDATYIASAATSDGASGDFQSTEFNGWLRYSTLLNQQLLFAGTGIWNSRYWSGPDSIAMPPHVNQFALDLQLASVNPGPWNWMFGVTPQINSDFERQLTSDAYMVDARVVVFNKLSPHWTLAIGAAYWDRADDLFIPYGGVIWTPDDRWEVRAMFPKTRISYLLGNVGQTDVWLYGSGEYTVDAYQIDFDDATRLKDRAQFQDYRILLGLHAQQYNWSAFFEGGYITNREVDFKGSTPGFDIGDSWILRLGLAF